MAYFLLLLLITIDPNTLYILFFDTERANRTFFKYVLLEILFLYFIIHILMLNGVLIHLIFSDKIMLLNFYLIVSVQTIVYELYYLFTSDPGDFELDILELCEYDIFLLLYGILWCIIIGFAWPVTRIHMLFINKILA